MIVPLEGETEVVSIRSPCVIQIRETPSKEYSSADSLNLTSHRLYYEMNRDIVAAKLSSLRNIETRGGLLRSKKLVLTFNDDTRILEMNIRLSDTRHFQQMLQRLKEIWLQKTWTTTPQYLPRPKIGGINRVMIRSDNAALANKALIDSGLSDLTSLRANARGLTDVLKRLRREGTSEEINQIEYLLLEYGLVQNGATSASPEPHLVEMVQSALKNAQGVMLIHDMYCLINRKLRLEKLYTPKQFLLEIQSIKSIDCVVILGYRILLSLSLSDLNRKVVGVLTDIPFLSTQEMSENVGIGNTVVLKLLLLKAEEMFGEIVRDEDEFGQINWYRSIF